MSTAVVNPAPIEKPTFDFAKFQAERAAGTREPLKATEAAPATTEETVKRASGDERKFQRRLARATEALRVEFDAKLAAMTPKQAAAAKAEDAALSRADFATDEEFQDARVKQLAAAETKKVLDAKEAEGAQSKEVKDAIDGYNERMARGPLKYDDWDETLKAGSGAALNVDLSKECPALFWAITKSPYNDDCFYAWLKDSSKLQSLIDQYKADPGAAIAAFHRFEGRVGKDEVPAKKEADKAAPKAEDAAKPKPKPSAEASVRAGKAAPDGPPPVTLEGGVLNPAYKAYMANRDRRN